MSKIFVILANSIEGTRYSGGERIMCEIARHLSPEIAVEVCTWEDGFKIFERERVLNIKRNVWKIGRFKKWGMMPRFFFRIMTGIFYAIKFKIRNDQTRYTFYPSSDFWPDYIPFLILKYKYPKAKFIGTYYLGAPNPFIGFRKEYEKKFQIPKIKDFLYFFQHLLAENTIHLVSDYIFVTSEPDKNKFINKGFTKDKIFDIKGGVNFENYNNLPRNIEKIYEAVFYGRFHPQKGVLELIDIWKILVNKFPTAKLIMIGDGQLYDEVKQKIKRLKLSDNIILKGFMPDSSEKITIFSQSKVVCHPAVFDSGGMAAAEVMYLGIPGVSFDLESLKTYYPKGMLKTECFNLEEFADNIYKLLSNKDLYDKLAKESKECVVENFDWKEKIKIVRDFIYE